jgi:hypothetical protein
LTSERANTVAAERELVIMIRACQAFAATFIAIVGLAPLLQQASAELQPHRVYLPIVAVNVSSSEPTTTTSPSEIINVTARSSQSCQAGETQPVIGARITVISNQMSRVAMTDERGLALFSATTGPAVIQVEWPAGFLPCPHSRPIVELPAGTGEVEFLARSAP